nr:hypothetical protein [Tanacetum cinerariifolium]
KRKESFWTIKYEDPNGALSKLLQLGMVEDYQREFEKLMNRVTDIPESLLISFCISGLKLNLQHELLVSRPTTLADAFFLARIIEARFEAITKKEQNIKEKAYTTLSFPIEEVSHVVKGPLDANEDTFLSLRSEDLNFKIEENAVEYVRALNVAPLKAVFTRLVDEVSNVIEDVFNIDESNVEGMQVRDKFAEFFEDKESVERSGECYALAVEVKRRKRVKCYVQGSGRRKRKKGKSFKSVFQNNTLRESGGKYNGLADKNHNYCGLEDGSESYLGIRDDDTCLMISILLLPFYCSRSEQTMRLADPLQIFDLVDILDLEPTADAADPFVTSKFDMHLFTSTLGVSRVEWISKTYGILRVSFSTFFLRVIKYFLVHVS